MTTEVLMKGFLALIFSGILAWVVFDRDSDSNTDGSRQRYLPYISGVLLPVCMLTILSMGLVFTDRESAMQTTLAFCFGVFLHICLYYLLLMPALPFLRRHISARACAVLWMLPNYLYLTQMRYMRLAEPRWVIEAPLILVQALLIVWLTGFVAVLGWKIISHLIFRARILRDASPIFDPTVLAVWRQEIEAARFRKPKFKLVASPDIQTPLSVGLFQRSIRVVLPEREYTSEELALIFRHELIHIGREDSWNKFFLVFCSAMCWFNPLMWMAIRRSSEDLELSCDETVLLDSDDDTKRQYADLLLRTAGDEQGFTTCLSASANALRYRLKSVVDPKKKPSGALVVGLVFFLLCMSCGYVALAYGECTGAEVIYKSQPPEEYVLSSINVGDFVCTDDAALHRYLSGLCMEHISGNYSFTQEETPLSLIFDTPEGVLALTLSDRFIHLAPLYGGRVNAECFYLPDGTDWDALSRFIVQRPALNVHVTGTDDEDGRDFTASLSHVSSTQQNMTKVLYEMDDRESPSGLFGYPANQASFSFNLPLNGDCTVEIVPLNGGSSRTVILNEQSLALSLPEAPSRYTVRGEFSEKAENHTGWSFGLRSAIYKQCPHRSLCWRRMAFQLCGDLRGVKSFPCFSP